MKSAFEDSNFSYELSTGEDILDKVRDIALFRIKYFKDYPYLYEGSLEYEEEYLCEYSKDQKSLVITIHNKEKKIVGVSTSIPLISSAKIVTTAKDLFLSSGLNPSNFFYYGEIILDYSIRQKGLSRKIYNLQDMHAHRLGYRSIAIATVIRDGEDSLGQRSRIFADPLWTALGFKKTDILFSYNWPTIFPDGSIQNTDNKMVYWVKHLSASLV